MQGPTWRPDRRAAPASSPLANERAQGSATARWAAAVLMLLPAGLMAGCSDYRPDRVPVSGRVLLDGQPLEHGSVRFIAPNDRPSVGELGPGGRFELSCFARKDGSVRGTHTVTVTAVEPLTAQSQKWLAPPQYADPTTSRLTATIDGPTDDLVFELTWDGRQPFFETFTGE